MATVTGITVERANQIENASVIGGHIAGGNLYLTTKGGSELNAGKVVPDIPPVVAAWPVGTIFMNETPVNPATLLGGGTWARWGQGRMPISLDSTNARFDTPNETGGAETVTLSINEMPSHNHSGATTDQNANHTHGYTGPPPGELVAAGNGKAVNVGGAAATTGGASNGHLHGIFSQGGGAAHENMPPYIVVYMWKRTA